MYYAYFSEDGHLLTVSSKQCSFPEDGIVMREVPDMTSGNSIYLEKETMEVRSKQSFAVEVSYNLISGLPSGTMVTLSDGSFMVEDGSAEFVADVPSLITVWLDHPRYLATTVEVQTGPDSV